jgi:nitrogen fixation protein FixH
MRSASFFSGELQGRHVLLGLILFFAAVLAVNGVFLYSALSTYTGVVAQEPYRKGLHYNQRIAKDEQQKRIGWSEEVALSRDTGQLLVELKDRSGEGVSSLVLVGVFGRPATDRDDKPLAFEELGPGRYATHIGKPASGTWLLSLEAKRGADERIVYRSRRRLWLGR